MNPIRILLADDHDLVRAGFRALLQSFEGMEVVGEAADGRQVLQLVATLKPDLVLMDIAMPELCRAPSVPIATSLLTTAALYWVVRALSLKSASWSFFWLSKALTSLGSNWRI